MRPILLALSLPLSCLLLTAQNPGGPPTHLGTQVPYWSTHYYSAPGQDNDPLAPVPQVLPLGYRGFLAMCDLVATADLTVSQVDFQLLDDGSILWNWGPQPGVGGPPGLVGMTASVNVYSTPGTYTGTWPTPNGPNPTEPKVVVPPGAGSPWTLLATGTLTVRPSDQGSPAVFPTPFTVPTGANGFVFEVGPVTATAPNIPYIPAPYALHPALTVSVFAPGAPMSSRDQFLSFVRSDIVNQAFVNSPGAAPKTPVLDIQYTVPANAGFFARTGEGCYDQPIAFYEEFQPSAPSLVDLSNLAFQLTPVGTAYAVSSIPAATVMPPAGVLPVTNTTGQPMGDDDRTLALPLNFTFPYPGGSTVDIVITSNGNIFLDPANSGNQVARFEDFGLRGFLLGQPQLAPLWTDLSPNMGGNIYLHYNLTAPVPVAYVTWLNVPEFTQLTSSNTVQAALYADGRVEYHYGACSITVNPAMVGMTPGWSPHDPGGRDLSTSLPFLTGDGAVPPELGMTVRPVIGTAPSFVIDDTPAGPGVGALLLGNGMAPLDLGFVGMPSCMLSVQGYGSLLFLTAPGTTTGSVPAAIPNNSNLLSLQLTGQAVVLSPGSNAAGFTVSNAIGVTIGL